MGLAARWAVLCLFLVLVAACGTPAGPGDGGADSGQGDAGTDAERDAGADAGATGCECTATLLLPDGGCSRYCSTDERCWDNRCVKFVRVNLDYRRNFQNGAMCITPICNVSHEADGGQAKQLREAFTDAGCTVATTAGGAGVAAVVDIGCLNQCALDAQMCCTWFPADAGRLECGWSP